MDLGTASAFVHGASPLPGTELAQGTVLSMVASQRSTGLRSMASNCHSTSTLEEALAMSVTPRDYCETKVGSGGAERLGPAVDRSGRGRRLLKSPASGTSARRYRAHDMFRIMTFSIMIACMSRGVVAAGAF